MKPLRYTLIALAAACGFASAQTTAYTTPVGYVTKPLAANQFTLVGLTLHEATKFAGVITAAATNSVTVAGVDFVAVLGAPGTDTYILELADGTVQEIVSWNSSGQLTTPENISGKVTPGTTTCKLRKAATVSSIFGAANTFGLKDSDAVETADRILILNASNAFDTVFYYNDGENEGWLDAEGNLAADKVISYPDGFFVQRVAGSPINMIITGEVKLNPTAGALGGGYNYLNGVVAAGVNLDDSGLKGYVTSASDVDAADLVLIQNPGGTYTTCFYYNDGENEGWLDAEGNLAGEYLIDGGFLLFNRGGVKPYVVDTPPSYDSL